MRCNLCPTVLGKAKDSGPWDLCTEVGKGRLHGDLQQDHTLEGGTLAVTLCFPHLHLGSALFPQESCLHIGVPHPLSVPHRRDASTYAHPWGVARLSS